MGTENSLSRSDTSSDFGVEADPQVISGKMYPESGIALVRFGDVYYFIEPDQSTFGEAVHVLTPHEFSRLRMRNLHISVSMELSPEEIGTPPFDGVTRRLLQEQELAQACELVDVLLDPLEQLSAGTHYCAAWEIEDLLRKSPHARQSVMKALGAFIPPEEYVFDTVAIVRGYDAYMEQAKSDGDEGPLDPIEQGLREPPAGSFGEAFPLLFDAVTEAFPLWVRNARVPGIQRLTRLQIQQSHDSDTDFASGNLLRSATEARDTFRACLDDMAVSIVDGRKKWNEGPVEKKKLADAKGKIVRRAGDDGMRKDRARFADTDSRIPGVLGRFDAAVECFEQAKILLQHVEEILGEIQATKFL